MSDGEPRYCQNPEADCYRQPDMEVQWSEDVTSDSDWNEYWLCDPCASIMQRGMVVSQTEFEVVRRV